MAKASEGFKQQVRQAFEEITVGQTFTFRRTFTEGEVALFCGVTGDYNPYHLDETFAAESWYGRRIIPGLLTGSMVTHIGGMIGFLALDMHFDFKQAVYIGDTITCVVTFTEKDTQERVLRARASFTNQRGENVLEATFKGFPSDVRLAR